ncbi:MAG: bifunctional aspartate kinase/homoserine dehydrogenase I [Pseudoflavonifractor sp.]|nr:bifunctional aspartate kinase/homoserine dehydrogenase I [Alloprevotella sp.]MCM1117303.1 bifunctional aspartate kinase/homoserine dehydrogenase I [Pseudoflavonifractor sp.]
MKVLKFGGTSVGTVESLANVRQIVADYLAAAPEEPLIVVVSALGGITDKLIATARLASEANAAYVGELESIIERHHKIVTAMIEEPRERGEVMARVDALLDELSNIYKGVSLIRDLSPRTLDIIVSYGERLSSTIIEHILPSATLLDSRQFIKTVDQFDKHVLDTEATARAIAEAFTPTVLAAGRVALVPGFIATASERDNEITNLGRGGSDYTAAILAAALGASCLEIWTDVDGFLTADPRQVQGTYVIPHLSFIEAMELCNYGAKVIYPPTIYPVFHKSIPILIKNTFNPSAPGTLISDTPALEAPEAPGKAIRGISSINDTCLITVSGLGMVGIIGINARIFNALTRNGVSVFMVSQASSENTTSFAVRNSDADRAVSALENEFAAELQTGEFNPIRVERNLATIAIVGENMRRQAGVAGRLFNTLGRNGINVKACAQGASETNLSFVVNLADERKALNLIHESFFLSDTRLLNLFIVGIGNVGCHLIEQIASQQERLLQSKALKIRVVGIANSRKLIVNPEGISLNGWRRRLDESPLKASPQLILDEILGLNLYNTVFVDCTSSDEIAGLYPMLLDRYVNVVAANKRAASDNYDRFLLLKDTARRRDVKFLFETNVGAGLPIINTIDNLINSGDRIIKIEAVLSGTLNYIFNTMNKQIPLSQAIRMAREEGYSEPDPRDDLSGADVIRKIVILAREAGYRVDRADVEARLFIPDELFQGSLENFYAALSPLDTEMERARAKGASEGKRFRFVARMDAGRLSVGLEQVDSSHPFYHLEGSNNVILLTTERYHDYPMEIKGYGAGAEVTAAGVFADIISIANIR